MDTHEKIAQAALRFASEVQAITVEQMRIAFAEVSGDARSSAGRQAYEQNYGAAKGARTKNGNGTAKRVNGSGPKKTIATPAGRVRRSQEQIAETAAKVLAFVTSKPGSRMEDISAALGSSTHELARPVQVLLGEGKLRRSGTTRATVYNVGRKG